MGSGSFQKNEDNPKKEDNLNILSKPKNDEGCKDKTPFLMEMTNKMNMTKEWGQPQK